MTHFGVEAGDAVLEFLLNGDPAANVNFDLTDMGISQTLSDVGNDLYLALCTGDPGAGGTGIIANECTQANYQDYARKAIPRYMAYNVSFRPTKQWTITAGAASNAVALNFPTCGAADGAVVTHWALCKDQSTSVTTGTCLLRGVIYAGGSNVWKIGYYSDTTTGTFYSRSHGFVNDDIIKVSQVYDDVGLFPASGADGLVDGNTYYIKAATTHSFELSLTDSGGANLTLLPTSRGAISFIKASAAASVTVATNAIPSFAIGSLKVALY